MDHTNHVNSNNFFCFSSSSCFSSLNDATQSVGPIEMNWIELKNKTTTKKWNPRQALNDIIQAFVKQYENNRRQTNERMNASEKRQQNDRITLDMIIISNYVAFVLIHWK